MLTVVRRALEALASFRQAEEVDVESATALADLLEEMVEEVARNNLEVLNAYNEYLKLNNKEQIPVIFRRIAEFDPHALLERVTKTINNQEIIGVGSWRIYPFRPPDRIIKQGYLEISEWVLNEKEQKLILHLLKEKELVLRCNAD